MITARELMRPCPTVPETTIVADLVTRMADDQEYFCAVVDSSGRLTGILTEFDLVRLVYESGAFDAPEGVRGRVPAYLGWTPEQLRGLPVARIMTNHPETVRPEATVQELAQVMFRHRRKVVLVCEGGNLLGAVQRVDVIKRVLR